jgi:thiol-disulfide isomerase/thioredoxin
MTEVREVRVHEVEPRFRRRAPYLIFAALLVVISVVAVAVAMGANEDKVVGADGTEIKGLKDRGPAPELKPEGWLNTAPLQPDDLKGKVVVFDFWTYSCVNCVRTLPYLRSWYDRYQADGLQIVVVHSPEFDFERNHANVEKATKKLGVTWPVAFDDHHTIWHAFDNQFWPSKYITDREGHIRHFQAGEGQYERTENLLRALLGVTAGSPRATPPGGAAADGDGIEDSEVVITPETYLFILGGGDEKTRFVPEPQALTRHRAYLVGQWSSTGVDLRTGGPGKVTAQAPGAQIVLSYVSREVNLVMASPNGGAIDVIVTLDGQPVPEAYRTSDIKVDPQGQTIITVTDSDLYRIVLAPLVEQHDLRLRIASAGLEAFAFTFGT